MGLRRVYIRVSEGACLIRDSSEKVALIKSSTVSRGLLFNMAAEAIVGSGKIINFCM